MKKVIEQLTQHQANTYLALLLRKEPVYGSAFGDYWCTANDRLAKISSRDSFGTTSAGYRSARKLVELGLAEEIVERTHGGYTCLSYTPKSKDVIYFEDFVLEKLKVGPPRSSSLVEGWLRANGLFTIMQGWGPLRLGLKVLDQMYYAGKLSRTGINGSKKYSLKKSAKP